MEKERNVKKGLKGIERTLRKFRTRKKKRKKYLNELEEKRSNSNRRWQERGRNRRKELIKMSRGKDNQKVKCEKDIEEKIVIRKV